MVNFSALDLSQSIQEFIINKTNLLKYLLKNNDSRGNPLIK